MRTCATKIKRSKSKIYSSQAIKIRFWTIKILIPVADASTGYIRVATPCPLRDTCTHCMCSAPTRGYVFPWLSCVPFANILVHALVYSVSCRSSLSKEETWRFSGLLIAGPACDSVISWALQLPVLNFVWCPFLLAVVLLCWRPTSSHQNHWQSVGSLYP